MVRDGVDLTSREAEELGMKQLFFSPSKEGHVLQLEQEETLLMMM